MSRRVIIPVLLLIEFVLFTWVSAPDLSTPGAALVYFRSYFADLLAQAAPVLLVALGMTLVLMTAGIDLSVGSMTALIAAVMASFPASIAFWWAAVPAGLVLGLALGLANGVLIGRLDIPPIVATLGTMILYRGLCLVVLGDRERAPFVDVPGYEALGQFTGSIILVVAVYGAGGWLFFRSRWRRELLMIGGNRVAARYAGIPVTRRLCEVYALGGMLAFLAALCFTARNSSVSASSLTGFELQVIVAVVLGGTPVQGGTGSLSGTVLGVIAIAMLDEGLRGASGWGDTHLPFKISHLEYILLGILLVAGVALSSGGRRRLP